MTENARLRAGFVGLGTMGLPMARNLVRRGFPLVVSSRSFEKAKAFAAEFAGADGARTAVAPVTPMATVTAVRTPAEVAARCDVLVSCVPDGPDVEEVYLGAEGAASAAAPSLVAVDCSTIAAGTARRVAAALGERGIGFLDAPVSGGQKGAVEATLTFFIGGTEAALERARPVLEAMGRRLTHLGPSGAGQLGKATNQVVVAGNLLAVAEGIAFAARAGLPLEALHGALTAGAATSWALEVLGKKILARDFAPAFAIKHQQKDLAIVLETARANGVPLPGVALVHQLLSALEAEGRGEDGTQALYLLYEKLSRKEPS